VDLLPGRRRLRESITQPDGLDANGYSKQQPDAGLAMAAAARLATPTVARLDAAPRLGARSGLASCFIGSSVLAVSAANRRTAIAPRFRRGRGGRTCARSGRNVVGGATRRAKRRRHRCGHTGLVWVVSRRRRRRAVAVAVAEVGSRRSGNAAQSAARLRSDSRRDAAANGSAVAIVFPQRRRHRPSGAATRASPPHNRSSTGAPPEPWMHARLPSCTRSTGRS
jgi:hypothetical protein